MPALRHFVELADKALEKAAISIIRGEHDETDQAQGIDQTEGKGTAVSSHLLPTDSGWTEDKNLIADLSTANAESSRYILHYLDVDAGQAEPISIDDEYAFGQRLINVGAQVRHRASQREEQANSSSALSYERSDTQPSDDKT